MSSICSGGCLLGLTGLYFQRIEPSPLSYLYREIRGALKAGLYYAAIAVAVSIPDVCDTVEVGDARASWKRYKAWFNKYASTKFEYFDADTCYELRCGVSHNAKLKGGKNKLSRFDHLWFTVVRDHLFTENISVNHAALPGALLQLDVNDFCERMIAAAQAWERAMVGNEQVRVNMHSIVRYRPWGLRPISGIPVIA
jgi:hypothetical protein